MNDEQIREIAHETAEVALLHGGFVDHAMPKEKNFKAMIADTVRLLTDTDDIPGETLFLAAGLTTDNCPPKLFFDVFAAVWTALQDHRDPPEAAPAQAPKPKPKPGGKGYGLSKRIDAPKDGFKPNALTKRS